jgi:hypothetical protein
MMMLISDQITEWKRDNQKITGCQAPIHNISCSRRQDEALVDSILKNKRGRIYKAGNWVSKLVILRINIEIRKVEAGEACHSTTMSRTI